MKKAILCAVSVMLFLCSGSVYARGKSGLGGFYLFLELEVVSGRDSRRFYDVLDFSEIIAQHKGVGNPSRICSAKVDGVDYKFWILTVDSPKTENFFLLTVKQSKNGNPITDAAGDVSIERASDGERHLFVSTGTNPRFYFNIYGGYNSAIAQSHERLDLYWRLSCKNE